MRARARDLAAKCINDRTSLTGTLAPPVLQVGAVDGDAART
jgi:hypothetical protein